MKWKLFTSALFSFRNLSALLIAGGAAYLLKDRLDLLPLLGGVGVLYVALVIQSLGSKDFHEKFNHKQKVHRIQELNYACLKLASEARKQSNPVYAQRLRRVLDDKDEIVNSFFRGEQSYLKEKIVEQTLTLVASYVRLLTNFCVRTRELTEMDLGSIADRINVNTRKLNFSRDPDTADEIRRVIEMDEKIIGRLKDERKDLERISAKLDYMESTVNMFKHQIISSVESEEMLEHLETVVNEAAALDSVLEERRKSKIRR